MVVHLAVQIERDNGNTILTTTLCGRSNKRSEDGTNSSTLHYRVDCELCKAIMSNPNHWRNRKFLASGEKGR